MQAKKNDMYGKIKFENPEFKILVRKDVTAWIDSGHDFTGSFHEEIEIKYFFEGEATLLVDNKNVNAKAGDIVFINPYELHSTLSLGAQKGKYHIIMLGLDFFEGCKELPDLRRFFFEKSKGMQTHICGNKRAASIVNRIAEELSEKKKLYDIAVRGLVAELFAILVRDYAVTRISEYPSDKSIAKYNVILPALNLIRSNYARSVGTDELALACNVSKYYFCRIFKEVTGMTAIDYLTDYRLHVADVLLSNTSKSISDIATECGFEDASYFSRCYKKHKGVSPKNNRAILSK